MWVRTSIKFWSDEYCTSCVKWEFCLFHNGITFVWWDIGVTSTSQQITEKYMDMKSNPCHHFLK